ncbi:MAG TPA: hypothetical protein VE987_12540, partial [Polyangiaceae bacterium]|nr:hypothetical protein [Polyangiaceae bacterium]
MMKRTSQVGPLAAGAAVWLMLWTSPAAASLAPSEAEQVRHEVATAQNVGHVRALVARPDLTSSEAAEAMAAAMSSTPVDPPHAAFLHELVFGSASAASRPMLAVAVVHGLLARADSLLGQHQTDLDRAASAVAELERAYALVEDVAIADAQSNVTDSAREECARALRDHVARNAVLRPDTTVSPAVAAVRAQAAIALLDASADTPSRRVDVANALALTAARRAALVELGVLVLDTGGSEARVSAVRALLDHLGIASASGDVVEAVVLGDERASRVRARAGAIVAVAAPSSATSADAAPWGAEAPPPPVDAATMAAARGLAAAAVRRALE